MKYARCITITADLNGTINDINRMGTFLNRVGYQVQKNIFPSTTRKKYLEIIRSDISKLKSGDTYVLYHSGHGISVRDRSGDEVDGKDEALSLGKEYLLDDDLTNLIYTIKDCNVFVICDTCHSGSMIDMQCVYTIEKEGTYKKVESNKTKRETTSKIVYIGGCADSEVSLETSNGGFFTNAFLRQLEKTSDLEKVLCGASQDIIKLSLFYTKCRQTVTFATHSTNLSEAKF